jgi:hypothetical protein
LTALLDRSTISSDHHLLGDQFLLPASVVAGFSVEGRVALPAEKARHQNSEAIFCRRRRAADEAAAIEKASAEFEVPAMTLMVIRR